MDDYAAALHAVVEKQRAQKRTVNLYEDVDVLKRVAQERHNEDMALFQKARDEGRQPPKPKHDLVAVNLTVLGYDDTNFPQGWHYDLINKRAQQTFAQTQEDLKDLKLPARGDWVFRLSVWDSDKNPKNPHLIQPGQLLFSDSVNKLSMFGNMAQGEVSINFIMKAERDPDQSPAKRPRTTKNREDDAKADTEVTPHDEAKP